MPRSHLIQDFRNMYSCSYIRFCPDLGRQNKKKIKSTKHGRFIFPLGFSPKVFQYLSWGLIYIQFRSSDSYFRLYLTININIRFRVYIIAELDIDSVLSTQSSSPILASTRYSHDNRIFPSSEIFFVLWLPQFLTGVIFVS